MMQGETRSEIVQREDDEMECSRPRKQKHVGSCRAKRSGDGDGREEEGGETKINQLTSLR
jgi:hypothetical protein